MLAHPELAIPGKLNVKAGVVMLLAAIVLGLILSQVQPLLPARRQGVGREEADVERCLWGKGKELLQNLFRSPWPEQILVHQRQALRPGGIPSRHG